MAVSVACAGSVYFLLTQVDLIVHGQLYSFGLIFNAEWADPYRTLMWSIYGCVLMPVALSGAALVFGLTKQKQELPARPQQVEIPRKVVVKPAVKVEKAPASVQGFPKPSPERGQNLEQRVEETPKFKTPPRERAIVPELEVEVEPEKETQVVTQSELENKRQVADVIISCPKCKKTFHRPLVMLDFSGPKPRLVNVCPFCNQMLGSSEPEMGVYSSVEMQDELVKHGDY